MKIYMVTDGEYSDYHVIGVYSTRENAERAKELFAATHGVNELDLDALPEHPPGMLNYEVKMDVDGNTDSTTHVTCEYEKDTWAPYGDNRHVSFYVWAKDEAHAVKIANEKRAKLIATGEWTLDWKEWREKQ